jgi:hypothetical protein
MGEEFLEPVDLAGQVEGEVSPDIKDAALSFEAVKTFIRQTKDGVAVGFTIDPMNVPADLYTATVGSRYYVSLVQIGDDEQPVKPPRLTAAKKAVSIAHLLCRDLRFQSWMDMNNYCLFPSEECARTGLLGVCGIKDRGEFATNEAAREILFEIRDEFRLAASRGEV